MKGYKLAKPFELYEKEAEDTKIPYSQSKIRITKALITLSDVLRFMGETESKDVIFGSAGIGILSETDKNLFDLEKGKRVYIEPSKECNNCFNCKKGEYDKCSDMQIAGEDYDGFLSDFAITSPDKLFALPDSVPDDQALFIHHISLAIAVFDKLNIKKGDYVSIIGANNFANIFAQLLIYYQAVPIVMSFENEDCETAKQSGIYYVFGENDNWLKEVSHITGGRMTDKVVYVSDCNIPVAKAFSLASFAGSVAFTGLSNKTGTVSFLPAVKKQLNIHCINSDYGYTAASINVIANKVINFSHLKINACKYKDVPKTFDQLATEYKTQEKISETIVDLI